MKTNVLIPMAGEGRRFKDAGYTEPKPMIDVLGEPMIRAATDCFALQDCGDWWFKIITVSSLQYSVESALGEGNVTNCFVGITTEGPACTALIAKPLIVSSEPLIIVNCDQVIKDQWVLDFAEFCDIHKADVVLGCFLSTSPKNSYVRVNDDGQIIEVREKEVISNIATNGLHWFRRGSDFVRAAEKMIAADDRVNGEFYIAPSVNYLIAEGLKVMPFFFNLHFPIGTPEDLQKYEALYAKT